MSTSSSDVPEVMKAVVVREHGGFEVLKIEKDYPVPQVKDNQVLIKNEFAGLNFIDTYFRRGIYKKPLPFVVGQEGGGVVVKTSASSDLQIGDRVVYVGPSSYAEYTAVDVSKVTKLPDGVEMSLAVACMIQALTAHYLTTDATVGLIKPDQWMLIFSAGSGTCQWAAQMAKLQGYKVIATTSKSKQAPPECDHIITLDTVPGKTYSDFTSVNIQEKVMEVTGGAGVRCVVDGIGASTFDIALSCLAMRGVLISFGNAGGVIPPFSILKLSPKSATLTRPKLGDYIATKEEFTKRTNDVFGWIEAEKLKVHVDRIFSIDNVAEGHEYIESGQTKGKILFQL